MFQEDIDKAVGEQRAAVAEYEASNNGLGTTCKNWQLTFETSVRDVRNYKEQLAANQQRAHEMNKARASQPVTYNSTNSSSNSNVVQCTKMGDLSFNKNIQTFNGMICPLGWMPYYGW